MRPVSTAACPPPSLGGRTQQQHSLSGSPSGQPARVLQHQQQRAAFGLPNLNGDATKHYQERRLIGCACLAACMLLLRYLTV